MPPFRLAAPLALLLAVAGCQRIEGAFAPTGGAPIGDLRVLDGAFAGNATYASGPDRCQRRLQLAMRVANGQVQGELRDPRTPDAQPARFDGFIDTDGGMAAIVRAVGDVLILRGRFRETRFEGMLEPEEAINPQRDNPRQGQTNLRFGFGTGYCQWTARLSKQGG
jgi:hypothetical protein